MIINIVALLVGIGLGYGLKTLYLATRPEGSPWRPDVRRWWSQNEDLMEVERRKNEEINARDFADGQKSDVVKRIEQFTAPVHQDQRDTPPHTESDRHAPPVALRQPGDRSEGRDAATSGHLHTERRLVAFDNDDPLGAWVRGQVAEYLGPTPGTGGRVHGFRLVGTGEVLDLTDPFGRGLVHRVLGDEPHVGAQ